MSPFVWIPCLVVPYLMIGGISARVVHRGEVRDCNAGRGDRDRKHCTLDKRCRDHTSDAPPGLLVLFWAVFVLLALPYMTCAEIGDRIDDGFQYWAHRDERRALKRKEQRDDYEHAVKVLKDAGVNVVKIEEDAA